MIRGFTAGNFDVIHPGYIKLFKECYQNCDHFTILLHSDPSIERPNKLKPILTLDERIEILAEYLISDWGPLPHSICHINVWRDL